MFPLYMYPRHHLSFESRVLKELPSVSSQTNSSQTNSSTINSTMIINNKINPNNQPDQSLIYPDSFHISKTEIEKITIHPE